LKQVLLSIVGALAIVIAGGYLFRAPLLDLLKDRITADMFVAQDTDSFDPGLAIGDTFPPLHARYQGKIVSDMGEFVPDRGMIFIANRSADW